MWLSFRRRRFDSTTRRRDANRSQMSRRDTSAALEQVFKRAMTMSETRTDDEDEKLMYPELLTKDALISALQKRLLNCNGLQSKDKEQLVDLASRMCLPLPQREYTDNTRRGRWIKQQRNNLKRKSSNDETGREAKRNRTEQAPISPNTAKSARPNSATTRSSSSSPHRHSEKRRKHSPIRFP